MNLNIFVQHFINALSLGSLYGLVAVGYTMVYGILRLINFAHGDIFMLGAYFVYFATIVYKLPWAIGVIIAIILTTVCGLLVDRIAYRPLREAPRISALISAIGVSFFIENFAVVVFTGMPRPVVQPPILMNPVILPGDVRLIPLGILVPVVSFVLVGMLLWLLYCTKPGLAMRAISFDIETTRMMGVSVNKIIALAFGLGSALAAVAGILWALRYPRVEPFMGMTPGIKAFIAAVFGGIGSVPGAMIGGLILGFVEIMSVAFFPTLSGYKDAFAFCLLILILLFRPTGLLGERLEDKI
ncbi:MAG: branched-chain amino acid ABC transporter permease [Synergistaceae bacterium]|nr:branched-chain amino acid ABC transporter permease [Synergistaceae bacterium]MBQ7666052.1 branched-chain amino acid ABC transporter permease [Synergistaceae bacterium]